MTAITQPNEADILKAQLKQAQRNAVYWRRRYRVVFRILKLVARVKPDLDLSGAKGK